MKRIYLGFDIEDGMFKGNRVIKRRKITQKEIKNFLKTTKLTGQYLKTDYRERDEAARIIHALKFRLTGVWENAQWSSNSQLDIMQRIGDVFVIVDADLPNNVRGDSTGHSFFEEAIKKIKFSLIAYEVIS